MSPEEKRIQDLLNGGFMVSPQTETRISDINSGLAIGKRQFSADPEMMRLRQLREQQAKGYSTEELAARKRLTLNEQDANRARAIQRLRSNLGRGGVGGARGAAMEASADNELQKTNADVNRKMLLDESEQQRKGIDSLSEDIYRNKLGEAGYGIGSAQLGASDRAAQAARDANKPPGKSNFEKYTGVGWAMDQLNPTESGSGGGCCFIFLEARYGNGTMDSVVRRFRDENMTPKNQRGYYKLSEVLVPLMRRHKIVKLAVQTFMTSPMVAYGKAYYNQGTKLGFIFKPLVNFWLKTFNYLGDDHKFIRSNGETV